MTSVATVLDDLRRALVMRLSLILAGLTIVSLLVLATVPVSSGYRLALVGVGLLILIPVALAWRGHENVAAWVLWAITMVAVVVPPLVDHSLGANVFFLSCPAALAVLLLPGRSEWLALITVLGGAGALAASTFAQGQMDRPTVLAASLILMAWVAILGVVLVLESSKHLADLEHRLATTRLLSDQLAGFREGLEASVAERTASLEAALSVKRSLAQRLEELNLVDDLTGLANRRMLDSTEMGQDSRALIMADLDDFKRINDTHSHALGDEVLRRVGGILRETAPPKSLVARYGGEEFVLLLPGCELGAAEQQAESIRTAIAGYDWGQVAAGLKVTASLGVAQGDRTEEVLARADTAMQRAKSEGRNRVVTAL